ncbi:MAG TPA: HD-GYP domain-containing protein [Firmicutes bacterium]|nr:HD-GYP domain-containing protein [Bacillota bacterium]
MRFLALQDITEGMHLGKTIFGDNGRVLLAKGTKLTKSYLQKIGELGYTHLYVFQPDVDKDWLLEGPLSDYTYSETLSVVKKSLVQAAKSRRFNLKEVNNVIDYVVDEIMDNPIVLYNLIDMKKQDEFIYEHSVNVCIISSIIGKNMGLARDKVKQLAIGALLHDLGKVYVDPEVLNKPSSLTEEEFKQVKEHTKYGFEVLRSLDDFSILSAHIAYQHHEREDGSGYPRGLLSEEIHSFAKIVAVADSFEAMTANRKYRKKVFKNDEAIRQLTQEAPKRYDTTVIETLKRSVALYPVGCRVLLRSGEQAVVVKATPDRAFVRILAEEKQERIIEVDPELQISKCLD